MTGFHLDQTKMFKMKFFIRIGTGIVFVTLILIFYLYFGREERLQPPEMQKNPDLKPPSKTVTKTRKTALWPHSIRNLHVIKSQEECTFAEKKPARTDFTSIGIYEDIKSFTYVFEDQDVMSKIKEKFPDSYTEPLKVIFIPHSHNDPGWLDTIEGYFSHNTRKILNYMVVKLKEYPEFRFVWSETVFLAMWWSEIGEGMKEDVRDLIKEGRLEILNGGWVVPDEATTTYFAYVDQLIEGHQWLEQNIGVKPNNTWAIDPFGYSATMPYIHKNTGFQNMAIMRINANVKSYLRDKQGLEFQWRQQWDANGEHDIFTHVFPYQLYSIKHSCGPNVYTCLIFDFRNIPGEFSEVKVNPLTDETIEEKAKLAVSQYRMKSQHYRHNVIFVPIGDDFRYNHLVEWDQQYQNYKKLIDFVNSKENWNVKMQFGTLNDYFEALRNSKNSEIQIPETFPSFSGDFYSYTDRNNEYWTGYFTSRPYDKVLSRKLESSLRAAEILNTLAVMYAAQNTVQFDTLNDNLRYLVNARQLLGLFQHHDAITGTERAAVVVDYEFRLSQALSDTEVAMLNSALFLLSQGDVGIHSKLPLSFAEFRDFTSELHLETTIPNPLDKLSILPVSESKSQVVVYNSLPQRRQEVLRLVVNQRHVIVKNSKGVTIPSQINPHWINLSVYSNDRFELVFVVDIQPLGMEIYTVASQEEEGKYLTNAVVKLYNFKERNNWKSNKDGVFDVEYMDRDVSKNITFENDRICANFKAATGMLQGITLNAVATEFVIDVGFLAYTSQGSGAYIFLPAWKNAEPLFKGTVPVRVIRGPIVSEIHVVHDVVIHVVRVYHDQILASRGLEIVNKVDIKRLDDREIIMRFSTEIQNNEKIVYSDLNGFQMIQRKFFQKLPAGANYYPMTSIAYIEDDQYRLSLLSGQSQGVAASQYAGRLEVMLDRKLHYDDARGMGEGLNDNKPTQSRFFLLLETAGDIAKRSQQNSLSYPSLISHSISEVLNNRLYMFVVNNNEAANIAVHQFVPLSKSFPCDVSLVNLRSLVTVERNFNGTAVLLKRKGFECRYPEDGLSCTTSSGQISLKKIFKFWKPVEFREVTLSYMHSKSELSYQQDIHIEPMELKAYFVKHQ
ncbi:alpha-mannosidase 2 isoform X2 [Lingula anatina]|uniref:Alpha-mannosidase n=1 Tax=Lingula anatina TaxID=7574 RepID=A0A1S3JVI2_LINAN|nr:alpha-mannosidase 2 isoform X1 [Lingula anatina]XP_013414093.1 alpha-mannosidase 2 isoform X2 [Lingula anatina]XP_013414094.1 alpha-mannosidase 2 isoform X2 [Lingula anatina]|eukprot:XP_013414092.1 alpha-mannosidase 2 isoform X1 [Lingula anatina]